MADSPQVTQVRPTEMRELTEIVHRSAADSKSIAISAGGTHASYMNLGSSTDIELDMTGLDRIIDYSPVDLTLAVEPGVRLSEIDRMLAAEGQRIALDMPRRDAATIGGTFASGLSGPRRLRYGSLKDVVIGAEIVAANGDVTKTGGMVVKNVSGYEMARLHYGAHGAFGIVSRLNLKVLPAVEARVEVRTAFDSAAGAVESVERVLVSTLDPSAAYIARTDSGTWVVHVQLEGSAAFTEAQSMRVQEAINCAGSSSVAAVEGDSTPVFDRIADLAVTAGAVARLSVAASKQRTHLESLEAMTSIDILADMGSGLIYVRDNNASHLTGIVDRLGVPAAYLALPDDARRGIDVFGPMDEASLAVLRRLKQEFDPHGIFNPGRFAAFL